MTENTQAGFIAIIGATNAGKSTLLNTILGQKIAIVNHKVQTTRVNMRGILTVDNVQYIFVDTPGIYNPKQRLLDKSMVKAAWSAGGDADVVLLLVDANKGFNKRVMDIIARLQERKPKRLYLAFNKIDEMKRDNILELMAEAKNTSVTNTQTVNDEISIANDSEDEDEVENTSTNDTVTCTSEEIYNSDSEEENSQDECSQGETSQDKALFDGVFAISAKKDDGVETMIKSFAKHMPESPYLYDEEHITDSPMRQIAAEMTREQAYIYLHEEIPYALAVETVSYEVNSKGAVTIHQNLLIEKESQKYIVVGKGGSMIKQIGENSRKEIMKIIDRKVNLFLKVKVKSNWAESSNFMLDIGLEPVKK